MTTTVLISTTSCEFPHIQTYPTFKDVNLEQVDVLIYHDSKDDGAQMPLALSSLGSRVSKILYINSEINPLLYCIFMGLGADIYDSDDALTDVEVLDYYVENYKKTGYTMKAPDMDVETLTRNLAVLTDGSKDDLARIITNSHWIEAINSAMEGLQSSVERSMQVNQQVTRMLTEIRGYISILLKKQEESKEALQGLQEAFDTIEQDNMPSIPTVYPAYTVPERVLRKTLFVKAVAPCRFLVTFFGAYTRWVQGVHLKQTRLLIVLPRATMLEAKYKNLPQLEDSTLLFHDVDTPVTVTFQPRKSVLDKFFDNPKAHNFIVLDLTYNENILRGPRLKHVFAVSGLSDYQRLQLNGSKCLFPLVAVEGAWAIPRIPNFTGMRPEERDTAYQNKCIQLFEDILAYVEE